jgi:hypothetical protein
MTEKLLLQENAGMTENSDIKKGGTGDLEDIYEKLGGNLSLALITAVFYLICYRYYMSFSERLSLPYQGIDMPMTLIIGDVAAVIAYVIASAIILVLIVRFFPIIKSYSHFITAGISVLINITVTLMPINKLLQELNIQFIKYSINFLNLSLFWKLILIITPILIFSAFAFIIETNIDRIKNIKKFAIGFKTNRIFEFLTSINIYSIIGLTIIIIIASDIMGSYSAQELIEGKKGNFELELFPENNISIPSGPLILLMIRDGNYYLVQKQDPAPKNVRVIVIPSNKIKYALTINTQL